MGNEIGEIQLATTTGDGFAAGSLDGMGEGYGFRKVRRELGVEAFGVNAIVLPPHFSTGRHWHDEQQELYFVHEGTLAIHFGMDGEDKVVLGPGGFARVDASTVRRVENVGDTDATYVIVGGKGGYVGRDGRAPEGESRTG
jgi:mannose-6-phosphate isomerase-like protein (cupin superfamily)